ncbi:SidA/IucD/PvdA family monooxygenase [Microcoleus sp. AR_TQ3_B6]|uniref:SidA/IucD/PvdA family monooxygenase n=1 Tax=Microcoleus sp. AR_TQ3_B6 TaxID=3055284 RepID=UPI002FD6DDD0
MNMQNSTHTLDVGEKEIFDLIGIGIGPFNLGLAALLSSIDTHKSVFFDTKHEFSWHEGLLLEDCYLQVPFFADLVTMSDPTSPYSFLNYLHTYGRLYQFSFYETFHIPRNEYNRYCRWVANRLQSLQFGHEVVDVSESDGVYCVTVRNVAIDRITQHYTRNVVLGVGTNPTVPHALKHHLNDRDFIHTASYKFAKSELQKKRSITVIGSGQSAAECFLDLLPDQLTFDYELNWLTRSRGFLSLEYSKLVLEHFSPDYIEYFYGLSESRRQSLLAAQGNSYKGISSSTIKEIYDCLYIRSIDAAPKVVIQARSELTAAHAEKNSWKLDFHHIDLDRPFQLSTEAVVLGSGYNCTLPQCLNGILHLIEFDSARKPLVSRDYTLQTRIEGSGDIFVQNGEMHTHGISAPDLGLGRYRNSVIINRLLGYDRYPTSTKTVFQTYGIAPHWQSDVN